MNASNQHETKPPEKMLSTSAFQMAMDARWKAVNELERLLLLPLARLQFALVGVAWASGWKFYGLPIIQKHRRSTIIIGQRMELRSSTRSNPLGPNHAVILSTRRPGAALRIGDYFGMTGGSIVCEEAITIGNRVTVGANCMIVDTDFHPLEPQKRQDSPLDGATAPIVIEDDVFIGMQSII